MNFQAPKPRPVKYCADCGVVIAGAETPKRVYNAIRYCPACAKERKLWSNANSQKQFRLDRKERGRLQREQCALLQKENAEVWRRLHEVEKLYQEANGYV